METIPPRIYDLDRLKRLGGNRRKSTHRKAPPNVKELGREEKILALLERDGPLCQCGCRKPVNPERCEIEHTISLDSVRHLPDAERAKYFELSNQTLFIAGHQKEKTGKEAGRRAHFNRLAEKHHEHLERMATKGRDDD